MSSIMIFQVLPSDYVSGFWHLPGQPVLEVLKVAGHEFKLDEAFPLWKFWLIPGPFILLIGGWTVYLLQVSRRIPAATLALIGTFLVFFLFVKAIYLPIMHRPVARSFAQQINHHAKAGDEIILYSMHPDIKRVLFYLDADKLAQTRFTRNPELIRERLKNSQGSLYGVIREGGYFNDLEASDRSQLRINQFNWKWDMSRLDEFRKFLVVRQPLFEKMKSDMLYFQSLPVPLMSELQSDITSTPKGEDRRSRRRNRY